MDFTKIRLNGLTVIDLPIVGASPTDPYILKDADGLGPPEVEVAIVDTLNAGGVYQGRRPQTRELVLRVVLNPDYSTDQNVSDLRAALYGMLTPGFVDEVIVEIMNLDDVFVYTRGYVSKFEIVPFRKDPEVQITIPCTLQYFGAPADLYLDPGNKASPQINNVGTAPAGFNMTVIFTAPTSNWVLSDDTGNKMQINYEFETGDKLIIDTRPGLRSVFVDRGGNTRSILYALSYDSIWYMLHGGLNKFTTSSQDFNWGDVFYQPQYWGI